MCKNQGLSSAQFRCNLSSELCIRSPLLFYIGGPEISFPEIEQFKKKGLQIQACLFLNLLFGGSRPPQTMGNFLEISIAGRKCLCVSGKIVLWSKHFAIRIVVPMLCLKQYSACCHFGYKRTKYTK